MAFTVEADGDVVMKSTVSQPIYETARSPELASWEQAALVVWYRNWDHYLRFSDAVLSLVSALKPWCPQ
ncbi:hypothetical protein PC128_g12874 [Phytophthora cactorum]|nr:hypothetical protein PC120_g9734 [Phytophthora cactorum]KAG3186799.1 hypothetical protein PC128_g12874 [Phytophthora cactorum]KAG4055335.1 hypothetical protein PC123_g9584 [Phytophthora cactorum]